MPSFSVLVRWHHSLSGVHIHLAKSEGRNTRQSVARKPSWKPFLPPSSLLGFANFPVTRLQPGTTCQKHQLCLVSPQNSSATPFSLIAEDSDRQPINPACEATVGGGINGVIRPMTTSHNNQLTRQRNSPSVDLPERFRQAAFHAWPSFPVVALPAGRLPQRPFGPPPCAHRLP